MTQGVLQTDVYTDFQGLNALRSRAHADSKSEETLREVAHQFEALFLQMMLKSMRDASLGEGVLDNEHTKTYQSMFDKQIAIKMSEGRGIGLAEMMVQQLHKPDSHDAGEKPIGIELKGTRPTRTDLNLSPSTSATNGERFKSVPIHPDWMPESPKEFVHELWPQAKRAADELGTRPELLLAQAALETGWGQHMIRGTDGNNSFNLFGIKADVGWKGARVSTETIEFRDGLMRKERAQFRAYNSPQESFTDYVNFLKHNPRYRDALRQADNPQAFTRALSAAGYATDPDYAGKINRILASSHLQEAAS